MSIHLTDICADRYLSEEVLWTAVDWHEADHRSYWKMISCRTLGEGYTGRAERLLRMDPTKAWSWKENVLSERVRALVEPFTSRFYTHLTRVEVFLQLPGEEVPCHQDIITGQDYGEGPAMGKYLSDWMKYGGECNADPLQHRKQDFLGGRLSLGANGRSYTVSLHPPGRSYHNPGDWFYFLDETCWHGAEPTQEWRGVIFLDGFHTFRLDNSTSEH